MVLYHASQSEFEPGQVIRSVKPSAFSLTITAEGKEWVENILERFRPRSLIPRREALYAFDAAGAVARFAAGEQYQRADDRPWYFYEVEMQSSSRHPMYLVDLIYQADLNKDDENAETVAREYWTPRHAWREFEYLDREMRILARIDQPDNMLYSADLLKAWADMDLAETVWPDLH